ncbi:MAG: NlpC/P60 family protein [Sphingobacteriia bacterium]|nr:NlpC/P60 family protein [Sphingobacteriia bacterium]
MNTPYRWGGRSNWGIDCSGLVQMVFRSIGIALPRDAYQQYLCGEPISSPEDKSLAFFQNNEGKIVHVGIVLPERKILHASGYVKIEYLTDSGIWDSRLGIQTHNLAGYRRLIKDVI